jgi:hypothetical protein
MPNHQLREVVITLKDTPTGGVSCHSDFKPAVGQSLTPAQVAGLDIIIRTNKQWGISAPKYMGEAIPGAVAADPLCNCGLCGGHHGS